MDLFLSPHLDDAILSCGGTIRRLVREGRRVVLMTFFSGTPTGPMSALAEEFHEACGLTGRGAIASRREEDINACAVLGAEPVHLSHLECIYRRTIAGDPVYQVEDSIFRHPDPADQDILPALTRSLFDTDLWAQAETVYAPLTVGGHVDHRLLRQVAEIRGSAGPPGSGPAIRYYEDAPYVCREPPLAAGDTLVAGMDPRGSVFDDECWEAKVEAIRCYRSQVRMLWPDEPGWPRRLQQYARSATGTPFGERFWGRVAGTPDDDA
jgi:LmbE family N-acetylglucosaminyl deacetylase